MILKEIPERINGIIQEFVIKVNELLGDRVKRIILYGSYARGDFNDSSDIDIMILTDLNDEELDEYKYKIWDLAYEFEEANDFDIEINPLVKNMEKFNRRIEVIPFYMNVQKEGVSLNG